MTDDYQDDEIDDMPIQRVFVSAKEAALPIIRAAVSIFDLAEKPVHLKHGAKANGGVKFGAAKHRREVREGVTVVTGVCYPDNRMTPERIEAEIARRARQKPPPPTAGFKRFSKKFGDLVNK